MSDRAEGGVPAKPILHQVSDFDYLILLKSKNEAAMHSQAIPACGILPELVQEDLKHEDSKSVAVALESEKGDCTDLLMKKLGISPAQQSDPALLNDILRNEMKLDDCPAVMKLLGSKLSLKESMKPMLETIRESLIAKQPELHEFIATALNENLLASPSEDGQKLIVKTLNYMVLLDAITKGMAEDPQLMEDVCKHLIDKRKELGIREGLFGSAFDIYKAEGKGSGGMFLALKTKSVDVAIDLFRKLRDIGYVGKIDSFKARSLVELNIAEAVLADFYGGYRDNARVGTRLDFHPASKVWLSGNNKVINYDLSQEWDSLYEGWNMAFVAHCANPQLLFPKLLIPQVINANLKNISIIVLLRYGLRLISIIFALSTRSPA